MTDRSTVLPSPAITSLVRLAMRYSPTHRFDAGIPDRIADLLDQLDASEDWRWSLIGASRARM